MKITASNLNLSSKLLHWYSSLAKPRHIPPPYRHVVQIGDPTLRQIAEEVPHEEIGTNKLKTVIARMLSVFESYNCCGLAAPQIGVSRRIILFGISDKQIKQYTSKEISSKGIETVPLQIIFNPEMKITNYEKLVFRETCESVRGFYADVPRYKQIHLKGLDDEGNEVSQTFSDWTARIIQHELDHLNGKLYTDIMHRQSLTCGCWEVINQYNGGVKLPYRP